jgi:hypothetical protein
MFVGVMTVQVAAGQTPVTSSELVLLRISEAQLKKVDRRDVHPNPLRVSSGIVPSGSRVSHTEPSHSCLHLQRNLVRPLSLTEELRLCQNIEHYQISI